MTPEEIVNRMIQAQVGAQKRADIIQAHRDEYFTRFPSYKGRFTELEWYHIFLDFYDKVQEYAAQEREKEAVGFHEWMILKMRDTRDETVFRVIPEYGGTYLASDGCRHTTATLYAIYLKEKGGEGL